MQGSCCSLPPAASPCQLLCQHPAWVAVPWALQLAAQAHRHTLTCINVHICSYTRVFYILEFICMCICTQSCVETAEVPLLHEACEHTCLKRWQDTPVLSACAKSLLEENCTFACEYVCLHCTDLAAAVFFQALFTSSLSLSVLRQGLAFHTCGQPSEAPNPSGAAKTCFTNKTFLNI